jgi:uncharacterized membrane protein
MTHPSARCTPATRIAGWLSGLFTTATFAFLQDAYQRMPLLVPVRFEDGSPLQFAFKSPALVYLPVALQLSLGLVFAAVVVLLVRRAARPQAGDGLRALGALHAAEGIALLAMVWIAFQAVNAWRLASLYRRTFDADIELYALALITAVTATVVIAARAVLKVRESEGDTGEYLYVLPAIAGPHGLASAALAIALGAGIAVPFYLVAAVWGGLRHI